MPPNDYGIALDGVETRGLVGAIEVADAVVKAAERAGEPGSVRVVPRPHAVEAALPAGGV